MSGAAPSLAALQEWMMEAVVHPGSLGEALDAARPGLGAAPDRIVLPSARLSAAERVDVYREMYLLRMIDVLESDYTALAHFLGGRAFAGLVRDYVRAHPSRSFSLNGLGAQLPEFVRTREGLTRRAFCHDLARLELAVTRVFDAPETPPLAPEAIAAVPPESWEGAVLEPVAAFRLLRLDYPVNAYLQSVRDGGCNHPPVRRRATCVVVYRRDFSVYRLELAKEASRLLEALVQGRPLGEALAAASSRRGRAGVDPATLTGWFRDWVAAGLFRRVVAG